MPFGVVSSCYRGTYIWHENKKETCQYSYEKAQQEVKKIEHAICPALLLLIFFFSLILVEGNMIFTLYIFNILPNCMLTLAPSSLLLIIFHINQHLLITTITTFIHY
jgi:hypothetical protein